MMSRKRQIVKLVSALALFMAFMLPTAIQFVHVFGVHEHFVCDDKGDHVHQTPVKCEICTIQFVPFDSKLPENSEIVSPDYEILQSEDLPRLQFGVLTFNSNPLRGPPSTILS
ncbi:MAG: hypothetical protein JSV73_11275 [Flavobacteriaceae bacterium]|nr:MAG: hypothetical protein JSV73_11275 [Flavobacteriaceae bacterium]